MPVDTTHPLYNDMLPQWRLNDDACRGSAAVKGATTQYLPVPNPEQNNVRSERYQSYVKRAVYTNFTGRTISGLTGAVFRLEPRVELPPQIEYLLDDADNNRLALSTVAQRAVGEVLRAGRYVCLAEFPESPEGATAEDTAGLRAYIATYRAEDFLNWHETNGMLDLAVLHEVIEEPLDDGFEFELVDHYRVLRLRDGVATMQVYRENNPLAEGSPILGFGGEPFDEIPLMVIGSSDNNLSPDMPPISDIASLNIAHYRNSAEYEDGVFMTGQPMLHIDAGETSADQFVEANGRIVVGSREAVVTHGGGSVNLVQAQANSAAMEAMTHKETLLVRLGAQLVADAKGQETAEAARIRSGAETSVLNTVVNNTSDAFTMVLKWCARFMGGNEDDVSFELNRQYFSQEADPQLIAQLILGIDRGAWTVGVVQDYARRAGIIDPEKTNEDLDEEVSQSSPLM